MQRTTPCPFSHRQEETENKVGLIDAEDWRGQPRVSIMPSANLLPGGAFLVWA